LRKVNEALKMDRYSIKSFTSYLAREREGERESERERERERKRERKRERERERERRKEHLVNILLAVKKY